VLPLHKRCFWSPWLELIEDDDLIVTPWDRTHSATIVADVTAFQRPRQEICGIVLGAQSEPWSRSDEEVGELVWCEHVHLGWAGERRRRDPIDKYAEQLRQLRGAQAFVATLLSCQGRPNCVAVEQALDYRIEITSGSQVGEAWVRRATGKCLTRRSSGL